LLHYPKVLHRNDISHECHDWQAICRDYWRGPFLTIR
jgi:hypothetical protein